jgi:hypothetical protein
MYHPNLFGKEHMIMIGTNVTGHEEEEEEVQQGQTFMWGYGWSSSSSSSEDDFMSPQEQPLFEHQTLDIINADEGEEDVRSQQQQQQHQQLENDHTSSEGRTNFESFESNEGSRQIILPKGISACLHRHESLPPPPQQQQSQQQSQLLTSSKCILHYYATLWIILLLPIPPSRVYLHDHTIMQVTVGSFVGVILGSIYYYYIIRGGLCQLCTRWTRSSSSSSKLCCMESVVTSNFGKWIGLNYGRMGGKMIMVSALDG